MAAKSKAPFVVTLFDVDGCTIYCDELDTISQARARAVEYVTDAETAADAHRAEVRDSNDVCVFDVLAQKVSS